MELNVLYQNSYNIDMIKIMLYYLVMYKVILLTVVNYSLALIYVQFHFNDLNRKVEGTHRRINK